MDAGAGPEPAAEAPESLFDFSSLPECVAQLSSAQLTGSDLEADRNFFKGAKWSPDGSCLLTCSEDTVLRLIELPHDVAELAAGLSAATQRQAPLHTRQLPVALQCKEGECVYDYAWFPFMNSATPASCCFVSSCRDHPVHLWDAFTGALRATYRAYDQMDEIAAAFALAFTPDGSRLYCGFESCIRVFSTERAGRDFETRPTLARRKDRGGQRGIISSIAFAGDGSGLYAAGSYARTVGLYDERQRQPVALLAGHAGGVTQVSFSPDGRLLYSGARREGAILCWDVRGTGAVLARYGRACGSNQRLAFDVDPAGRHLLTGSQDGRLLAYPAVPADPLPAPVLAFPAHSGAANGVSVHPRLRLLATASGERRVELPDDPPAPSPAPSENALALWLLPRNPVYAPPAPAAGPAESEGEGDEGGSGGGARGNAGEAGAKRPRTADPGSGSGG